jgi:hypothetical protein
MVAASKMRNAQTAVEHSRGIVEPFVRLFGDYPGVLYMCLVCRRGQQLQLVGREGGRASQQQLHRQQWSTAAASWSHLCVCLVTTQVCCVYVCFWGGERGSSRAGSSCCSCRGGGSQHQLHKRQWSTAAASWSQLCACLVTTQVCWGRLFVLCGQRRVGGCRGGGGQMRVWHKAWSQHFLRYFVREGNGIAAAARQGGGVLHLQLWRLLS